MTWRCNKANLLLPKYKLNATLLHKDYDLRKNETLPKVLNNPLMAKDLETLPQTCQSMTN